MSILKAKVVIICVGIAALAYMSKPSASEWPALAVARNARSFASMGTDAMCAQVAHIDGALPYCLAIRHKEPFRCDVITDPLAKVLCQQDAKPKPM
jgi:hypothetical protein